MNLFAVCSDNGQLLKAQYESDFSSSEKPKSKAFLEAIRLEGRVSVNCKPTPLLKTLEEGVYLNRYEIARRKGVEEGTEREAVLRETLGDYYERRTTFDRYFELGEAFLYGALNIGNVGAMQYGEYCIVWKADLPSDYQKGYLEGDSLRCFVPPDTCVVDEAALSVSGACHETKQYLALQKHREEVLSLEANRWANCLCNEEGYIEAIFTDGTGKIAVSYIEEIRLLQPNSIWYADVELKLQMMSEEERTRYEETDEVEYRLVTSFQEIKEVLKYRNLSWRIIEDA